MSRTIHGVLLDAGYTLIFPDSERILTVYTEVGGLPWDLARFRDAERAARRVLVSHLEDGDTGTEPHVWRHYFRTLMTTYGIENGTLEAVTEVLKAAHAERHLWSEVGEGVPEALDRMRADGYRVAVISNADGRVEGLLEAVGLTSRLDFVIDSEVIGIEKPDPRIFRAGCERLGLPPEACLYVGDLFTVDVLGARGAGLEGVLLDPWGDLPHDTLKIPGVAHLPGLLAELNG